MELKNIVCSREWAERLKKAGWSQDVGLFWWVPNVMGTGNKKHPIKILWFIGGQRLNEDCIQAPTGTELGMVIVSASQANEVPLVEPNNPDFEEGFIWTDWNGDRFQNEIDARASQVCWMLEQGIIKLEDIKEVLSK